MPESFLDQAIASGKMLAQGAATFADGMQTLAQNRAFNDANEQLQNLNAQELSREDRLKAQTQIGNQLAMKLGAAGASPQTILSTADRLSPSGSEQFQAQANLEAQTQTAKNQQALEAQKIAGSKEIEAMKLKQMQSLMGQKSAKAMEGYSKDFANENKDDLKAIGSYDDALQKIQDSANNPAGANMAKMSILRGAVGRVNIQEIQQADANQGMMQGMLRRAGIAFTNEDTTSNTAFWNKMAQGAKDRTIKRVQQAADSFAQGTAATDPMVSPAIMAESLKQKHLGKWGYRSGGFDTAGTQTVTPPQGVNLGKYFSGPGQ